MGAPVVGFAYTNWRLSDPIPAADVDKLTGHDPDPNFSDATLAGDVVTVPFGTGDTDNVTVQCHQLNDNIMSFTYNPTAAEIDYSSLASNTVRTVRGRETVEFTGTMTVDYESNKSYDVIGKNPKGYRLLYVERQVGKKIVSLVQIFGAPQENADDGKLTISFTMKNAGSYSPEWT